MRGTHCLLLFDIIVKFLTKKALQHLLVRSFLEVSDHLNFLSVEARRTQIQAVSSAVEAVFRGLVVVGLLEVVHEDVRLLPKNLVLSQLVDDDHRMVSLGGIQGRVSTMFRRVQIFFKSAMKD